ncbi:MAG: Na+/H+ antiporter NhaA [Fibrobacterota bacterium]|nr:Na+/H+ antiporter NhaA [Fibrobacterota bacterium]
MPNNSPAILKLARTFRKFVQLESASGLVLLAALGVALIWANSPWSGSYFETLNREIGFRLGGFEASSSLHHFINDGLMAIFFFVVGLEIKREMVAGELASFRQAALPIAAALGGMVVPALIYAAFNVGEDSLKGWGIPMATDIPFALGILALLGNRVPPSLKIFLMALAIIDDLGAVLVIAVFYSQDIGWTGLGQACIVFAALISFNRLRLQRPFWYLVPGVALWHLLQSSGVHGTIAGVLVAWTIPARSPLLESEFVAVARRILDRFESSKGKEETPILNHERVESVMELEDACEKVEPPLQRLIETLHPWTSFFILPLFALANAGVRIDPGLIGTLNNPAGLGILFGLVVGKPLGIFGTAQAMLAMGFPPLSGGVNWKHLLGAGMLGGIGFTMSIFIAGLAFGEGRQLDGAKLGIFLASALAGILGWVWLRLLTRPGSPIPET